MLELFGNSGDGVFVFIRIFLVIREEGEECGVSFFGLGVFEVIVLFLFVFCWLEKGT